MSSYWPLIFVALAVIMAVGPIMLMKPSKRDQRIASLRQKAAQQGLHIRLDNFETSPVAVYSLNVELPKDISSWLLLKQSYSHGLHFHHQWEFQVDSDANKPVLNKEVQQDLQQFLDRLPNDIVGLELNPKTVGIWWLEKRGGSSILELKGWLEECATLFKHNQ
jgi:hypothetical protein